MKRVFLAALVVFLATATLVAQEAAKADIKGSWDMSIETPQGGRPLTMKISEVDGEKITGALESQQGVLPFTGKFVGSDINFVASFDAGGQAVLMTFTGKLADGKLSGSVDFGGFGSGGWSAQRSKGR